MKRPHLAKCAPMLATIAAGADEIETVLEHKNAEIELLQQKLESVIAAHNVTLSRLAELRAERGEPQ